MCNNYAPTRPESLQALLSLDAVGDYPAETRPDYDAPMIQINQDGRTECVIANFGFAPKEYAREGMPDPVNARVETIGKTPMFAPYWRAGNLCIVPAQEIFEWCYETGKAVRHRIWLKDQPEFGIAGLWRTWPEPGGGSLKTTFVMITVNAEDHALFRRMHKPTNPDGTPKEKRGVVMLRRDQWDDWLTCKDPERARTFLQLYPAELMDDEPAPSASRSIKPKNEKPKARPKQKPPESGDLLGD
ncbi:SOS response-associated peptidase [Ralstonia insidiosa]|uniref:Abasic site processing protein n=1 Tax=Ralstonia insidiosa TaxID=190721 RepID=A0A848NV86_9RALS|nr:SOS response-associated peptidase family protein [Ralstonia insidiosa]NMV37259.1 hypothetical protein [Ralstonia insidiosa]